MGAVIVGIPEKLAMTVRECGDYSVFIETGTNKGNTAAWAAEHFNQVITIEGSQVYYELSTKRLADKSNVIIRFGDTRKLMPDIVNKLSSPALFWLDSHWCGKSSYGIDEQCPLLSELSCIAKSTLRHAIMIDDARLFLSPPPPPCEPTQWPELADIIRIIESSAVPYYIAVHDDIILAVPKTISGPVKQHLFYEAEMKEKIREENCKHPYRGFITRVLGRNTKRLFFS